MFKVASSAGTSEPPPLPPTLNTIIFLLNLKIASTCRYAGRMFKKASSAAGTSEPPPLPPTTVVADFKRRRQETEAERFVIQIICCSKAFYDTLNVVPITFLYNVDYIVICLYKTQPHSQILLLLG